MLINLNFNSEKPIYLQIKEEIIKSIATGNLKVNESLPSVRSMAEEIGINLHTVNKAYNLLKDEGYIRIDRRKGAIVNSLPLTNDSSKKETLKEEIELLTSKSYLNGICMNEFLEICKNYYENFEVKEYE